MTFRQALGGDAHLESHLLEPAALSVETLEPITRVRQADAAVRLLLPHALTPLESLGRFLQHARIFHFGNGGEDEYVIGSADWRPRNMRERVEVATPVRWLIAPIVSSASMPQKLPSLGA